MTEHNPFEKPIENKPVGSQPPVARGPEPMPTGVMVVSIIAVLLGVMGLMGSCFGTVSMFASESFMSFLPPEAQEATKEAMAVQFLPGIIQSVLGMVLSAILLAAAIGCLTRKPWGQNWMKISMYGCILSSLLGIAIVVWTAMFHADTMAAINEAQGMSKEQSLQFFYAGQIFTGVMALAFLVFYIFGAIYFGKQHVTDFFERQARAAR